MAAHEFTDLFITPKMHIEGFDQDQFNQFHESLRNESDRSIVIVTSAVADDLLKRRIIEKCPAAGPKERDHLFRPGGPFDSFSRKIDWLYCSGDLSRDVRDDLNVVRELRNIAAHDWLTFKIDESAEARYLMRMSVYKLLMSLFQVIANPEGDKPENAIAMSPHTKALGVFSWLIAILCGPGNRPIRIG